ncbi:hypothetical protein N5S92_05315 [Aliarcobacter cryaerophilus]|uniref:hypothetical protein n=1 Tax=Aliarcobacter cryaerophilus TaxID=28198 RepID=UPI0021B23680|nr:hypothetical protein [Aliarcobacter cryaerophilus]MCT7501400.1 hypothetical protein [Aliarcobacter cryaerophilus]
MCSNSKKQCTLTTIKIFGVLLIINLLLTVLGIEYAPLYWISNFTYDSLPLVQGTELTNSNIEKWGIRGQIGDIMSGHFSALAVLAVAYSITLQVEANQKMAEAIEKQKEALKQTQETIFQQKISIEKQTEANLEQAKSTLQQAKAIELQAKSIEQQNEALKVQSETLKAQIEELIESRKESEKQTEEFYIQNMNVTLDRYYNFLSDKITKLDIHIPYYYQEAIKYSSDNDKGRNDFIYSEYKKPLDEITNTLQLIFLEIKDSRNNSLKAYNIFIKEFKLRINSSAHLLNIKKYCPELLDKELLYLFD